jgi:hypothetical protein
MGRQAEPYVVLLPEEPVPVGRHRVVAKIPNERGNYDKQVK